MTSWKRKRQEEDKMAEECCFVCKDSGHDLQVCDSRNCLKAYHPGCVRNKDEGFICEHLTWVDLEEASDILSRKLKEGAERQRPLEEVPEVVPDTEFQVAASNSSEENRVHTSPKRGAQSSSETSEPKKPRLSELVSEETTVAATELAVRPSSWPACLVATQSGPQPACPSSRALVRVPNPTGPKLAGLDLDDDEAELGAMPRVVNDGRQVLAGLDLITRATSDFNDDVRRLLERLAAKSRALHEKDAALQSAERALREARSEAEGQQAEARRMEERAQRWSTELADVRRRLEDALEDVDRPERERDSSKTARQAAVEKSARLVAELRGGKAASDTAAQEFMQRADSAERARRFAEAGLIGCRELIARLERQLCSSMEVRRRLQAKVVAMTPHIYSLQHLAVGAWGDICQDDSRVLMRQLHELQQAAAAACDRIAKDGVSTPAIRRR